MSVTIMIDGCIKRNRNFGFELQSLHVIEKRYNIPSCTDFAITSNEVLELILLLEHGQHLTCCYIFSGFPSIMKSR